MANIGGQFIKAANDADFVSIWAKWQALAIGQTQVYCWSGIQDPTVGQINGQPPGTLRWGAYGWGYLAVKDSSGATIGVEKFCLRAEGIGALPADITGISGIVTLSTSGILSQFTPF